MNPESIQKIIDALEKNGGQAIEALGQYQAGVAKGELILTVIGAPLFVVCALVFAKCHSALDNVSCLRDGDTEFNLALAKTFISGAAMAVLGIVILCGFVAIPTNLATLSSPKGAAIQHLLGR